MYVLTLKNTSFKRGSYIIITFDRGKIKIFFSFEKTSSILIELTESLSECAEVLQVTVHLANTSIL